MLSILFNGLRLSEVILIIVLIIIIGGVGSVLVIVFTYFLIKRKHRQDVEEFIRNQLEKEDSCVLDCEFLNNILESNDSEFSIKDFVKEKSIRGSFVHDDMFFIKDSIREKIVGELTENVIEKYEENIKNYEEAEKMKIPLKEMIKEEEIIKLLE